MKSIYIASGLDFGSFCCTQEDRHPIDEFGYSDAVQPNVWHVFADWNYENLELLKRIVEDEMRGQYDGDAAALAELDKAVWHTGGWVLAQGFQGAEPKRVGWQEWTLTAGSPNVDEPGEDDVGPIFRLRVEQHRVF